MPWSVVLVLAAVAVLVMVLLGLLAVRLAQRVLAALVQGRARLDAARRDAVLQVQARALPPGPRREVAALRIRLRDSARATAALSPGRGPGPLAELATDVDRSARRLDDRLAGLLVEPDASTTRAALPLLRREVGDICAAGADLRVALRHAAAPHVALDETAALARHAAAVRQATDELRAGRAPLHR